MYNVSPTSKFQKDLKRAKKRGYDIDLIQRWSLSKSEGGLVGYLGDDFL